MSSHVILRTWKEIKEMERFVHLKLCVKIIREGEREQLDGLEA